MARSIDQVLADVTARSDPQRQTILSQISGLPTQQAADESSLEAKKTQAYDEILGGARRRGLGFSGIPLSEQASYAATEYAPALANLKNSYGTRKATLESALADIGKNDYTTAYDIFNQDRSFEEQQRQFNENLALQKAAAAKSDTSALASLLGGGGGAAQLQQRADKGFNFQGGDGSAVSAAGYSQLKQVPFRDLLSQMAKSGDSGAAFALKYVGNDYGVNKAKLSRDFGSDVNSYRKAVNTLNAILWGVNRV